MIVHLAHDPSFQEVPLQNTIRRIRYIIYAEQPGT